VRVAEAIVISAIPALLATVGVRLDGLEQVEVPVMQEEQALTDAP
jgi:hypothetical protein